MGAGLRHSNIEKFKHLISIIANPIIANHLHLVFRLVEPAAPVHVGEATGGIDRDFEHGLLPVQGWWTL